MFQTWLLLFISYMGCHPKPIDELHYFSRWLSHHQPALKKGSPKMVNMMIYFCLVFCIRGLHCFRMSNSYVLPQNRLNAVFTSKIWPKLGFWRFPYYGTLIIKHQVLLYFYSFIGRKNNCFTILFSYWFSITTIENAIFSNQKNRKCQPTPIFIN